jgi:hypothetical protein
MTEPRRVHPVLVGLVVMGVIGGGLTGLLFLHPEHMPRASYEAHAAAGIKILVLTQDDFRRNDRDADGRPNYWRADIAGLYALVPAGSSEPIRLIDLEMAGADAAPGAGVSVVRAPMAGYFYKALVFADEDPSRPDPDRFAACAFPASPGEGRVAYIVSHEKRICRRSWEGPRDTPTVYPADPLKEGWKPLD